MSRCIIRSLAFTSPGKSYVTADPGYEAGMHAAGIAGARVIKVPLTSNYSHDVRAMLAQAPDAGLFYPSVLRTIPLARSPATPISEYLLEHKPQGSVVMVDEAYLHFADGTTSAIDLVKARQRRNRVAHLLEDLRHGRNTLRVLYCPS